MAVGAWKAGCCLGGPELRGRVSLLACQCSYSQLGVYGPDPGLFFFLSLNKSRDDIEPDSVVRENQK